MASAIESRQSIFPQQRTIYRNSSFCAFRDGYSNEQDIARGVTRHVDAGHAAFFSNGVTYDAPLFIAFATQPFP